MNNWAKFDELRRSGKKAKARRSLSKGRRKVKAPNSIERLHRQQRRELAARREQARRIIASQRLGNGPLPRVPGPRYETPVSRTDRGGVLSALFAGQFAHEPRYADIDLGFWTEALHPRGPGGRWIPKGSSEYKKVVAKARVAHAAGNDQLAKQILAGKASPIAVKQHFAKKFLARHNTEAGIKVVDEAGARAKAAEAGVGTVDEQTRTAQGYATTVLSRLTKFEPKITADLKTQIEKHSGAMEGLKDSPNTPGDNRLKSHKSMTRKIRDKAKQKGITQEQYAAEVGDGLRYTTVFDGKSMVKNVSAFKKEMEAKGYKFDSIENSFGRGQAYSGVNMNIVSPDGVLFEVQMHTPESIKAKHNIHDDYEIYRSMEPGIAESDRIAAYNRMVAVNRQLIRPNDWQRLGTLVTRPDAKRHREALVAAAERSLYERGIYKARRGRQKLRKV